MVMYGPIFGVNGQATGNFTKTKKTNLVHLAYKWNGNNQVSNIVGVYDATHLNNEIAASTK